MLLFSLIICSCLFNMTVYNKLTHLKKNICIFSFKYKKIKKFYQVLLYAMNITKYTNKTVYNSLPTHICFGYTLT